jgi:acyl carrier protein
MGLDALDLCFRLEKKFGITIRRDEAIAVFFTTPGTIHRHLMAKLNGECQKVPAIEPLYLEVAKAANRSSRPQRPRWLSRLIKKSSDAPTLEECEATWKSLEKELGVSLPCLEHPIGKRFFEIYPRYDAMLTLTYWIAENHPERVKEWIPVSCKRSGKAAIRTWTEDEVWDGMCDCIVAALGVKRDEITADARMLEDLGID